MKSLDLNIFNTFKGVNLNWGALRLVESVVGKVIKGWQLEFNFYI